MSRDCLQDADICPNKEGGKGSSDKVLKHPLGEWPLCGGDEGHGGRGQRSSTPLQPCDFRAPAHASVDRAAPAYGVERERSAGGSHPLPCQRLVREDGNKGTSSSRPSPRTRFHQIHGLCMYYMRMLTSPASITGTGNSSEKTSSGALWSIESQRISDV